MRTINNEVERAGRASARNTRRWQAGARPVLMTIFLLLISASAFADPSDPGVRGGDKTNAKFEKVAYLGITAKSVDAPLRAQLKLPEDTAITVTSIDRKGPAAADLQVNDVLTKLEDQILIDSHQLVTLIHLHKPGDTVTLSLIRESKPMQMTIKLGEKERVVPDAADPDKTAVNPGDNGGNNGNDDPANPPFDPNAPLPRGNQTAMTYSDDTYSASVKADTQGRRHMTVKDLTGQVVASGPVDTEEQWQKFKPDVREHLEMLHRMLGLKKK